VIQHTPLSLVLIQAGIETPLYHKRALWMSIAAFHLGRMVLDRGPGLYRLVKEKR
jgi:hypothetical protein